jgi:acyl-CoA synthetase (AMP-forming)/AMP-acid ligase II
MIVTGGQNVYPHEVEAALQGVPGVAEVVAAGLKDSLRGTQLVAGILPEGERPPAAGELRRRAVDSLALPKRPRRYYLLEERPVTAAGKLSRAMLAQWIEEGDPRVRALQ